MTEYDEQDQAYQDLLADYGTLTLEYETLRWNVLALLANDTEENREACRVTALFGRIIDDNEEEE